MSPTWPWPSDRRLRSAVARGSQSILAGSADAGAAASPTARRDPSAGHRRPRHGRAAHAARLRRRPHRPPRPAARRAQRQFLGPHQRHDGRSRGGRSRRPHPADRRRRPDPARPGIDHRQGRATARCGCCGRAASPPRSIEAAAGVPLRRGARAGVEAPGMLASHYAPARRGAARRRRCRPRRGAARLRAVSRRGRRAGHAMLNLSRSGRSARGRGQSVLASAARSTAAARSASPSSRSRITGLGEAINDRLARAAAPRDNAPAIAEHGPSMPRDRRRPARPLRRDRRAAPRACAPRPTSRPTCTSGAAFFPAARRWC